MIIYATELHLFSATSANTLNLPDTLRLLQLDAFDLWRTCESFISFDSSMPKKVREHFIALERHIVQFLSWLPETNVPNKVHLLLKAQKNSADQSAIEAQGQRTLEEDARKDEQEAKIMKPYNMFFCRVLHFAAQTVAELSKYLGIDATTTEIIWSVIKVALAQESDLLIGRHLDQLVICTIYGVCRVHPNCTSGGTGQLQGQELGRLVLFNDLIEAYKEVSKARVSQVGRRLPGIAKPSTSTGTNVNWVFIDVLIDPWTGQKDDIIKFYNKVFLERMKEYIFTTRNMKLEVQNGNRTPQLTRSNFDALLTPGGRAQKPGIEGLCPMTPLIDQLESFNNKQRSIFSYKPPAYQANPSQTPNPYSQEPIGSRSIRSQILRANESTTGEIANCTNSLKIYPQMSSGRKSGQVFKNFNQMIMAKKPSFKPAPTEPSLMNQPQASPNSQQSNQVVTPSLGSGNHNNFPNFGGAATSISGPFGQRVNKGPPEPPVIGTADLTLKEQDSQTSYFSMNRSQSFMPMPKQVTSNQQHNQTKQMEQKAPPQIGVMNLATINEQTDKEDEDNNNDLVEADTNNNQKDDK